MTKHMKTMDGNKAAAYVSYAFTEVAAIYPITPSSTMAEYADEWSALKQKNIFGQVVDVVEMQSEAGAAGAVHGSLSAGALTTTYTASQGLLLMIPNMYKIAGEFLPGVMHVSARSLATHALNIFGDHSDVMACNQTGWAMLASNSVQEVIDLGGIAHLAAIKSRVPFLHFFDGFRTSHEQQKVEVIEYEAFAKLVDQDSIKAFKDQALNPEHPVIRGTNQNPDIFFQCREASNTHYENVPDTVAAYMKEISKLTGREYKPFVYYGAPDAEHIIVAMGSACDTIETVVDYLVAQGEKVGLIKVHLYRPFSAKYFFDVLPETVKKIAVLDRVKTIGAPGEPLYMDVLSMFYGKVNAPLIVGGRYGLGSKDTVPADIIAVFDNLKEQEPKHNFTLSIIDDVTNTSLISSQNIDMTPEGTIQCKFWGLGSDGTVGANKQAVEIIGDKTDLYAQAYFSYDSKKSGGITISHLRFGKKPIKAPYLITNSDFVSCSNPAYVHKYDLLSGLKEGGTFLLNCVWRQEELEEKLPASLKKDLAEKKINFYTVDAVDIAQELGLGNRTNMIMQSAFFKLAQVIPMDKAVEYLKESVEHAYGKKGQKIVDMNNAAIDQGIAALVKVEVPASWKDAVDEAAAAQDVPAFVTDILEPMNRNEGDKLPVSVFMKHGCESGTYPTQTSRYEKRGVASFVPQWHQENCIQCNRCSFVCPHASIRPVLLNEEELAQAPEGFNTLAALGKELKGLAYRIQVSPMDCQGCGSCAAVCPAKVKALTMESIESQAEDQVPNWNYSTTVSIKDDLMNKYSIKGSQFAQPLVEFTGACAGCGETPYLKLITQLFGDRMMIANATGCSSIWGGAAPSMPFCVNKEGKGPSWSNSLFEDNAEFGFGMFLGARQIRNKVTDLINEAITLEISPELKDAFSQWLAGKDQAEASKEAAAKIIPLLEGQDHPVLKQIRERADFLVKKSQWAFGGDGWAYDIGFGGVDHVLASGEDVNIFVYDTEVYSNTGGQSSKSTPAAAIAKFAASGKKTKKKDLGMMAMSYGYVYVAQIAMGADYNQAIKAIQEAENYPGPSLIIAYSPCINHGIKGGMSHAMEEMKKAVECGYWHLYRYNPLLKQEGKNPFSLDSKEPTGSFKDFIMSEVRYSALAKLYPEIAEEMFKKTSDDAEERYQSYLRLANLK
ncbi:pyruvate:ferredoxin (flavodoxin) oxidoreductase [Dehalobacterium formicoaceticum]|uniref:Pyruvate:ferredoxin oxidoreductase n=1 Tax=Dehalobacterium formicoaceticum TaxID=51515 RepID=A0ABT1Y824_9FIRM|nr:pyruvate:ferredoxin (flavodoxin) oxidoreductase [Dehalobacterium formicoaceticum]MCR6547041.1 pyruvate:ferredoxin (flavodoxin) oxidoreductase [Dehalobacterium formicoaceticum]